MYILSSRVWLCVSHKYSTHTTTPTKSLSANNTHKTTPLKSLSLLRQCCGSLPASSAFSKQKTGLFCRISSLLLGSFSKETCNFKEPTDRSHPIAHSQKSFALYQKRPSVIERTLHAIQDSPVSDQKSPVLYENSPTCKVSLSVS